MAKTLTRQQFLTERPDGDYAAYRRFLARWRPVRVRQRLAREAALSDPLRPLSDSEIQRRARGDIMPGVDRTVDEINRSITARSRAGAGAIRGYTDWLMQALVPFQQSAQAISARSQQSQAAASEALRAALSGEGQGLSDALAGKLAAINAPDAQVRDVAGGAARTGAASGATQFALGSADVERLIGEGAANEEWAAKMPLVAGLQGGQSQRLLELALGREAADRVGDVRSRVPGLVSDTVRDYRDLELRKSDARYERRRNARLDRLAALAANRAYGLDVGRLGLDRDQFGLDVAAEQRRASEAAAKAAQDARDEQARANDKRRERFTGIREDTFARARDLYQGEQQQSGLPVPGAAAGATAAVPKAEAHRRLWEEYGTLLIGQGFSRKLVEQMIRRALAAAGY